MQHENILYAYDNKKGKKYGQPFSDCPLYFII